MKLTKEQQKANKKLVKTLIQKAWEDENFKYELINNTETTIESTTGEKVNKEVKIVVEDQSDNSIIFLNIPREPNLDESKLTEEELNKVAGGKASGNVCWFELDENGLTIIEINIYNENGEGNIVS